MFGLYSFDLALPWVADSVLMSKVAATTIKSAQKCGDCLDRLRMLLKRISCIESWRK